MNGLVGASAELRFTVHVTSKETGETKTVEMVGFTNPADLERYQEAQRGEEKTEG